MVNMWCFSVILGLLSVSLSLRGGFQPRQVVVDASSSITNGGNKRVGAERTLFHDPALKQTRHKKKSRRNQQLRCSPRSEGQLRYISQNIHVCQSRSWLPIDDRRTVPEEGKLPVSCLDAKFKGLDAGKGDGLYWINPSGVNDLSNAFLAYCDMTTAGGGWLLVAKITHDYAWICPDRKGASCSRAHDLDPTQANLFHPVHERALIDMSITRDQNSGVHLRTSKIREMFERGQQSIRFTFVTADRGWEASEDAYAVFNQQRPNRVFVDGEWGEYSISNGDYTWNVVKHQRTQLKFTGATLCWGNNVTTSYRFYDHGLHAGSAANSKKPCHLANDEQEVMLKSHYALIGPPGRRARWDPAEFGFLNSFLLQAPCKRIALWVR